MKYLSLFSGIGGFEYGIEKAYSYKYEPQKPKQTNSKSRRKRNTNEQNHCVLSTNDSPLCIGYSEIDKYADAIYKYNFQRRSNENSQQQETARDKERPSEQRTDRNPDRLNGCRNWGDATKINERELPDFDLLVGGFPCQAFSIAGKRGGFDDTRGTLFFDIARILKHKRPRHLVLENVKGLLSHDKGQTFQTILGVLTDLGYRIEWQVLNSKYFGVPQNRERVFIVGHLRGECGGQVFPIRKTDKSNIQQSKELSKQSSNTLRTNYSSGFSNETYVSTDEQNTQERWDKPDSPNSIRRTSYTDGMRIRRLTPTECERLQGFPDSFTAKGIMDGKEVDISDTQRYKTLGNAVSTPVVSAVIERMIM